MIVTVGSGLKDDKGNTYIIDSIIGSGGFGCVYKAICESTGSIVAIKVIPNVLSSDGAYLSFQKETNQAKLIESENVIKYMYIHDGKEYPELPPYIIMEYTDKGTLKDLIDQQNGNQFDNNTLIDIFRQLANGMKCVSKELVHRDIKPQNILNFDGVLKISDFGLSKVNADSTKTMSFKNGGTPLYTAPEAWNNDHNTIQMDIYSMGIVFYELATLSYPYTIPSTGRYEDYRKMHLYQTENNPSRINGNLPPHIASMIIKMMGKPTQNRYKNWDEIIEALEKDEQPKDVISGYVDRAILRKNEKDLQLQIAKTEQELKREKRKQTIEMAYAQYDLAVLRPLQEFAKSFNSRYPGEGQIRIYESKPFDYVAFSTQIEIPSGEKIYIQGEIILPENYTYKIGTNATKTIIPQCKKRNIVLWCQVINKDKLGFNILLLENSNSLYGDWFIMENRPSGLAPVYRPSPFGFSIEELPEEINYIDATHVYSSDVATFSINKLFEFVMSNF